MWWVAGGPPGWSEQTKEVVSFLPCDDRALLMVCKWLCPYSGAAGSWMPLLLSHQLCTPVTLLLLPFVFVYPVFSQSCPYLELSNMDSLVPCSYSGQTAYASHCLMMIGNKFFILDKEALLHVDCLPINCWEPLYQELINHHVFMHEEEEMTAAQIWEHVCASEVGQLYKHNDWFKETWHGVFWSSECQRVYWLVIIPAHGGCWWLGSSSVIVLPAGDCFSGCSQRPAIAVPEQRSS